MYKNLNRKDILVRAILGLGALGLLFLHVFTNEKSEIASIVVGSFFLITAAIEFCPIYYILRIKRKHIRRKRFY